MSESAASHPLMGNSPWTASLRVVLSLVPVIDALCMVAAAAVTAFALTAVGMPLPNQDYVLANASFTVLVIVAFEIEGLYEPDRVRPPASGLLAICLTCAAIAVLVVGIGYGAGLIDRPGATWSAVSFAGAVALLCLIRLSLYNLVRRSAGAGRMTRNIVVVGEGEQARRIRDHMQSDAQPWNRIVAAFGDQSTFEPDGWSAVPVRGGLDDLAEFVRNNHVDDVVIALPWTAEDRIARAVARLQELPVNVHLGADLAGLRVERPDYVQIGETPLLKLRRKPLEGWDGFMKRVEDKVLASLILLIAGPLMLVIAVAIKLESRGPVFFRQPRYGFNNQTFEIFKFRTMYHDRPPETDVPQATRGDPRVTRVGGILRKTSLDELPQLFNVLGGSMSVVGPRPHAVTHNQEYARLIRGYYARHRVKPGITGWAQVNGFRGETDSHDKMAARVQHDVFYIDRWSLAFDIQIVVRTIFVGFVHPNAY